MPISYVIWDATQPVGTGTKIIVHICNDVGAWGAGFVMAISRRWEGPELQYRQWHRGGDFEEPFELGAVQSVRVERDIWVCNLIGQHECHVQDGIPPIRYDAVQRGLQRVCYIAENIEASIHMPRIGCGLASGDWSIVSKIIEQELGDLNVTVYDLP